MAVNVSILITVNIYYMSHLKDPGGWSDGAKVLGKLAVPGRISNNIRARAYSRCGWGLFGHFFHSSMFSRFFLSLCVRRPNIDLNTVSNGRYKAKTTNLPSSKHPANI